MNAEKRRAELLKTFANVDGVNVVMGPMVNDMVFLEQQHSRKPKQSRATKANGGG